ncbi:hypothetical protein CPC08DRAFT_460687 [Agrocybe pediades]|nr:hypothetical protein CPC08DRAFT_460687 [Agrocybe pediades]
MLLQMLQAGSARGSGSSTESSRQTTSFISPPMYDESVGMHVLPRRCRQRRKRNTARCPCHLIPPLLARLAHILHLVISASASGDFTQTPYFACVAIAIPAVGSSPPPLWIPVVLQPFMRKLGGIGRGARRRITTGQNDGSTTNSPNATRWRSAVSRAVPFTNRINGLILGMTKLKTFRVRQGVVCVVLVLRGIGGGSSGIPHCRFDTMFAGSLVGC